MIIKVLESPILMKDSGFCEQHLCLIKRLKMIIKIHYEVFSSAMKARLDPTYRLFDPAFQHPESVKASDNHNQTGTNTVLPFTTKTRAYGTYPSKK
jgi:hypothetical protein